MSIYINSNLNVVYSGYIPQLSEKCEGILQRIRCLDSASILKKSLLERSLAVELKSISVVDLGNILRCYFMERVNEANISEPFKILQRLVNVIPLECLNIEELFAEAKNLFEEAKYYLNMKEEPSSSLSLQTLLSGACEGALNVVESIITAFGVKDFFKYSDSDFNSDIKSDKIMMLFALFSMMSSVVVPLCGAASVSIVIGVILCISVLSIIWPFVMPMPSHLPANAENWTKEVQKNNFVAQGRKESLDEIANILKMNRHAILVGPSRVGKSLTAKTFAAALERGDYPELAGKRVFRINTTDLVGQKAAARLGGGNRILNKISAAMGRHRDNVILVFDEIHMACKNNEKMADQLKTFLDEGGEFPHVIGITTDEEYNNHVKDNNAFSLRFDKVEIKNTDQDETLKILADSLLRSRSKPMIKKGVINYLYQKSQKIENAPQPIAALKMLKKCINKTEKTQLSLTEKKVIEISNKILSLRSQAVVSYEKDDECNKQIAAFEKQLAELQAVVLKEKNEWEQLFKAKNLFNKVAKQTYASIFKVSQAVKDNFNSEKRKEGAWFFLLQLYSRALEDHIETKSKELGAKVIIDESLVDEVTISS